MLASTGGGWAVPEVMRHPARGVPRSEYQQCNPRHGFRDRRGRHRQLHRASASRNQNIEVAKKMPLGTPAANQVNLPVPVADQPAVILYVSALCDPHKAQISTMWNVFPRESTRRSSPRIVGVPGEETVGPLLRLGGNGLHRSGADLTLENQFRLNDGILVLPLLFYLLYRLKGEFSRSICRFKQCGDLPRGRTPGTSIEGVVFPLWKTGGEDLRAAKRIDLVHSTTGGDKV